MKIYTVGYGDKSFEQFVSILKKHGIERIVDVRSFPQSKWKEYTKETLKQSLPNHEITYSHLPQLGGYRNQGYQQYMKTQEFKKGIEKLIDMSSKAKTAIMCLESYPSGCHRRFISQRLQEKNCEVIHLIGKKGKTKTTGSKQQKLTDTD